jgi:hypothetical protein
VIRDECEWNILYVGRQQNSMIKPTKIWKTWGLEGRGIITDIRGRHYMHYGNITLNHFCISKIHLWKNTRDDQELQKQTFSLNCFGRTSGYIDTLKHTQKNILINNVGMRDTILLNL